MINVPGIAASAGIAIARAFLLEEPSYSIEKRQVQDVEKELAKFEAALEQSKADLKRIKERTLQQLGQEKADIFQAHLLILEDPELIHPVQTKIREEQVNADFALHHTAIQFIQMFENMNSTYLQERASDMRDVTKRVLHHLLGIVCKSPAEIDEEVIVIAEDLTPSDTAQLNREYVRGFTTNIGGRTSHSAIMARSLEIPAVVGTKDVLNRVENGDIVIVDGLSGTVVINPSSIIIEQYRLKQQQYNEQCIQWRKLRDKETVTKDGVHVELAANIGTPDDMMGVLHNGAEGVGLYRTEFLYMGRSQLPSEDIQYEAYKTVLQKMGEKPVVVRTLDIGGDKHLPYLDMAEELNPFLGHRAIRLCLDRQDIFRAQLRALLRASTYGNLRIMFPMISIMEELRAAKLILEEEKTKLIQSGVIVADNIQIGIMVEVPSTAMLADQFAKEVDFFSIGTNDLIQYTMAADRMNEQVSYLYQPYNPAILRLVKMVVDAAHRQPGCWVGMCGEMAGDPIAIPLLLGIGLDELSMSAASILPARSQIAELSRAKMKQLLYKALEMDTADEVAQLIRDVTNG